ncbi:MAG: amidohydrolase family protein [Rhodospirillales bacterium]|jgi:predicted TIM-barrel fold metal-dependent hydrolase|nr:amidohydrolase family protein [Rhodospirillales bacterium]MBT4007014.1 amidohydrolase family protein [Rhodospirillales bacterium]MBT5112874.1 amidohydrolase family protein [Rhodospirillales bacterium]MBT5673645.1 amidohydrolase family protein [Rhodospirillales bacterium]MBT6186303.1 amidohydrolase family protein [Rhodospirillales bacterium]
MNSVLDDMSARYATDEMRKAAEKLPEFIVSADGHVDEPVDMFAELPAEIRDAIKRPKIMQDTRPKGGIDPKVRITDMELDGLAAEVLYPTFTLGLFSQEQREQEAGFRVYNDWIADFCKTAPGKLFAIPCLPTYDIDVAIAEMHRCNDMGLLGGLIWQVPHPDLPLTSPHYEKLWAAAAELGQPIHFHILTGFNYFRFKREGLDRLRGSVNTKTHDIFTTVYDMIFSGVFERHPKLKTVIVEGEIGWAPFVFQQWDYYYMRNLKEGNKDFQISRLPSEIFKDNMHLTFMDDYVGGQALNYWGDKNCMWSSDYPHSNMTWPNSRAFIARQVGDLAPDKLKNVLSQNCIDLYGLDIKR